MAQRPIKRLQFQIVRPTTGTAVAWADTFDGAVEHAGQLARERNIVLGVMDGEGASLAATCHPGGLVVGKGL